MVALLDQTKRNPRGLTGGDAEQKQLVDGAAASHLTGIEAVLHRADHALLVTRRIKGGKVRRRVMLSLDAAQRAAARAEAAGQPATITLVQLRPVGHVTLDDLEAGGFA